MTYTKINQDYKGIDEVVRKVFKDEKDITIATQKTKTGSTTIAYKLPKTDLTYLYLTRTTTLTENKQKEINKKLDDKTILSIEADGTCKQINIYATSQLEKQMEKIGTELDKLYKGKSEIRGVITKNPVQHKHLFS